MVVSDSAARGEREDRAGTAVREILEAHGWQVLTLQILPDEAAEISRHLETWADDGGCDAIFTSGGTGLGPRDVTPEATRAVLDKEIPGLGERMRAEGEKHTLNAMLSRALAGCRNRVLIVNLPGSVRGARQSLEAILETLPHALDILRGHTEHPE